MDHIFVTGTDTDVGKTVISSWLCLHGQYSYLKPIQTGSDLITDTDTAKKMTDAHTYQESFIYKEPVSPHLAASLENEEIDIGKIVLPKESRVIIEGAGGVLVPINKKDLMIDLIKKLAIPVIITARSSLGTINHTLLTIEALRTRDIPILGVIMNGDMNIENEKAIAYYGKVKILASLPVMPDLSKESLQAIPFTKELKQTLRI